MRIERKIQRAHLDSSRFSSSFVKVLFPTRFGPSTSNTILSAPATVSLSSSSSSSFASSRSCSLVPGRDEGARSDLAPPLNEAKDVSQESSVRREVSEGVGSVIWKWSPSPRQLCFSVSSELSDSTHQPPTSTLPLISPLSTAAVELNLPHLITAAHTGALEHRFDCLDLRIELLHQEDRGDVVVEGEGGAVW